MACKRCGGTGSIPIDHMTVQECLCSYAMYLKQTMDKEILAAPAIRVTPFYDPPEVDFTKKSHMIKVWWDDLLPHLRRILIKKGRKFRLKIVTDEHLKRVWLGTESYKAKQASQSEDTPYENLADLIGERYDLVIIRLGFLGYKNVAMPGILLEALKIREVACKPTWLIEEPNSPWGECHRSYSIEVAEHIQRRYPSLTYKGQERTAPPRGVDAKPKSPVEDVALEDMELPESIVAPGTVLSDTKFKPKLKPKSHDNMVESQDSVVDRLANDKVLCSAKKKGRRS